MSIKYFPPERHSNLKKDRPANCGHKNAIPLILLLPTNLFVGFQISHSVVTTFHPRQCQRQAPTLPISQLAAAVLRATCSAPTNPITFEQVTPIKTFESTRHLHLCSRCHVQNAKGAAAAAVTFTNREKLNTPLAAFKGLHSRGLSRPKR